MGMFICCLCDQPGDSDDGCEELNGKHCHPECLDDHNDLDIGSGIDPDLGPTGHGDICWSDADPGL